MGELCAAIRDVGVPPVTGTADQRIVENVCPVLQLEVGAVGRGAPRLVDPDTGRPAGARSHQRGVQRSVGFDGEAGHPAVAQCDGARFETLQPRRSMLRDDDLGVSEVVGHRRDRLNQVRVVAPGDHQHRQRPRIAQVGVGNPPVRQRRGGGHPHGGVAGRGELRVDLAGVGRIGGRQHRPGERVAIRPAQRESGIGQVGVDVEVPVARLVGAAAGRRDAGPHQRHHQVARQPAAHRLGRGDDFGHRHRTHSRRRRAPWPPTTTRTSRRPGCPASTDARRCPPIQSRCAATQNRDRPRRRRLR